MSFESRARARRLAVVSSLATTLLLVLSAGDRSAPPIRAQARVTGTIDLQSQGSFTPSGIAVDPLAHRVYVSNRNNHQLQAIDSATSQVVEAVTLDPAL